MVLSERLIKRIEGLLKHEKWSSGLILKRLSKESEECESHERLYEWIWIAKHSNHRDHKDYKDYKELYKHLWHRGRRQKLNNKQDRRDAITGRVGIDNVPS